MASSKSRQLDRKKFFADPVTVFAIILVLAFLFLFIVYPLFTILTQSFQTDYPTTLVLQGQKITSMVKADELKETPVYKLGQAAADYSNEYKKGNKKDEARMTELEAVLDENLAAIKADTAIVEDFLTVHNATLREDVTPLTVKNIMDIVDQIEVSYENIEETNLTLEVYLDLFKSKKAVEIEKA